jgi:hypothetical protein
MKVHVDPLERDPPVFQKFPKARRCVNSRNHHPALPLHILAQSFEDVFDSVAFTISIQPNFQRISHDSVTAPRANIICLP